MKKINITITRLHLLAGLISIITLAILPHIGFAQDVGVNHAGIVARNPPAEPPEVGFLLDGSDPIAAREALNSAYGATEHLNQQLAARENGG